MTKHILTVAKYVCDSSLPTEKGLVFETYDGGYRFVPGEISCLRVRRELVEELKSSHDGYVFFDGTHNVVSIGVDEFIDNLYTLKGNGSIGAEALENTPYSIENSRKFPASGSDISFEYRPLPKDVFKSEFDKFFGIR
ncbi:MAG: hypothetical protein KAH93_01345 [Candidatus Aenigmarchaeota archaeon]|nr:hypothetical protein [Candidatus Aenigmarchaeota archaeon]